MLNKYPLWKYLLLLFVLLIGFFYAAPNLYEPDPALQITGESSAQIIDETTVRRALDALQEGGIEHFGETVDPNGRNALIRLEPVTGRSHQLRVHMLSLGHPILGDRLYAPPQGLSNQPRMLLHAHELTLLHPRSNTPITFTSELPF